ncbi:hypothetical protein [Burkholderia oklahomensis]|uniref:hypothetical protein n=1 Tax=Burkholderia oklahomensis TaxID=342113 RepID=UPI0013922B8A|nr:hypothetical protein [Burkholderia oklahomensis]MDN7674618.1 hypothetical protein [Burkholderia oklahomensis]
MNNAPNPIPCSTVSKSRNEISIMASVHVAGVVFIVSDGGLSALRQININNEINIYSNAEVNFQ